MPPSIDMIGKRFGKLLVTELVGKDKHGQFRWKCQCDCGKEKVIVGQSLRSGGTTSCGCNKAKNGYKHGYAPDRGPRPEYRAWINMNQRCTNPNMDRYPLYGGRGISVCSEWQHSFQTFLDYIGQRPSSDHSIDRIDSNGNYEPGNVRWADKATQSVNKRSTRWITYKDKTQSISAWARELGFKDGTGLRQRIEIYGVEKAIEMGGSQRGSH